MAGLTLDEAILRDLGTVTHFNGRMTAVLIENPRAYHKKFREYSENGAIDQVVAGLGDMTVRSPAAGRQVDLYIMLRTLARSDPWSVRLSEVDPPKNVDSSRCGYPRRTSA